MLKQYTHDTLFGLKKKTSFCEENDVGFAWSQKKYVGFSLKKHVPLCFWQVIILFWSILVLIWKSTISWSQMMSALMTYKESMGYFLCKNSYRKQNNSEKGLFQRRGVFNLIEKSRTDGGPHYGFSTILEFSRQRIRSLRHLLGRLTIKKNSCFQEIHGARDL